MLSCSFLKFKLTLFEASFRFWEDYKSGSSRSDLEVADLLRLIRMWEFIVIAVPLAPMPFDRDILAALLPPDLLLRSIYFLDYFPVAF